MELYNSKIMRCRNQSMSATGCLDADSKINQEKFKMLSINSPPLNLQKSKLFKEGSKNSDCSISLSEEGFIYAYSPKTLPEKAKFRENSEVYSTAGSSLTKSQESSNPDQYCTPFLRSRTLSNLASELCQNQSYCQKVNSNKPKVLKYIRNFSQSFCKMEVIDLNYEFDSNVIFLKAEHELDCQTYILKRRKIYIKNDEEIKDHNAYKEILLISDSSLPLNVRYVNSWVELDNGDTYNPNYYQEDGINVILYIQMRYIKDLSSLARDLILSSKIYKDLDEDDIEELADDTTDEINSIFDNGVSLRQAVFQTFSKIGLDNCEPPQTIEQQAWRICLEDLLSSA